MLSIMSYEIKIALSLIGIMLIPSWGICTVQPITKPFASYSAKAKMQNLSSTAKVMKNISIVESNNAKPVSFWRKQPPPGFVYFTFFIAIINLFGTLVGFVVKRLDRLVDRIYNVKHEYWTKSFLVPVCIEPLRDFALKNTDAIKKLERECDGAAQSFRKIKYNECQDNARNGKNELINRYLILNALNNTVYLEIANKLDDIEDAITMHCYCNSNDDATIDVSAPKHADNVIRDVYSHVSEILKIISNNHEQLFLNKDTLVRMLWQDVKCFCFK